jgi:hypothetical protein
MTDSLAGNEGRSQASFPQVPYGTNDVQPCSVMVDTKSEQYEREVSSIMVSSKLAAIAKKFPDPVELERRYRILTIIEAVTDNGHYRHYYYSQNNGNKSPRIASYDSGSGDHAKVFFSENLTFICAFDHEVPTNPWIAGKIWPGILHNVPSQCRQFVKYSYYEVTAALWHLGADWEHGDPDPLPTGKEPDPTFWMFDPVINNFSAQSLAEEFSIHTDSHISPGALQPFLCETPLTESIIHLVNPDASIGYIEQVAATAGYPSDL